MLFVNLFIEKIMKVSKQFWYSLEIFGTKDNREIFIAYIEDYIVGLNEKSDSSILFFDKEFHEKINSKLNNSSIIDNWKLLEVEEKNWNKSCEDFFKPIIINDSVRILPNWLDGNDDEFLNIIINPALAFGTGHHETTYMMIQAMLSYEFNGKTVFDIGTGSGILSILAKKRGAKSIYAIDNDILTNNNFHKNLELNDVRDISFEIKDCFDVIDFNYDFIFANINLNILKQLIPRIESKGTIFIISGILNSDEKILVKVLNDNDKKIKNIYKKNEWLCFIVEL
jgi:ribosomal protein L11 methyltransferase